MKSNHAVRPDALESDELKVEEDVIVKIQKLKDKAPKHWAITISQILGKKPCTIYSWADPSKKFKYNDNRNKLHKVLKVLVHKHQLSEIEEINSLY